VNDAQPLILVVDDEAPIRRVMELKLRSGGYDVLVASDGEEGLELAVQHRPALVFTDYEMPVMTGLEMSQQLKSISATCHTPIIMLTARGFLIDPDALAATNIKELLSKPFSPRQILALAMKTLTHPMGQEVKAAS